MKKRNCKICGKLGKSNVCKSCKEKQPYQASKKISDGGYGIPFERK